MKKIVLCFCILALAACVKTPPHKIPETTTKPQGIVATHEDVSFTQQVLLTNTDAKLEDATMQLITSMQELKEYIEKQKQMFDLTALEEETAGLQEAFFDTNVLGLAVVQGAEQTVNEVFVNDGVLTVALRLSEKNNQEKATWHIMITMKKAEVPTSRTVISIAS